MTGRLPTTAATNAPTITRHMFRQYRDNPECTYVEPGPGRRCREPKNHEVHTPNGTTRETWLHTKAQAAGMQTRKAAWAVLATAPADRGDDSVRAGLVEALHDLLDETSRWKDSWAHSQVDKDRQVRHAMQRADSCEWHGALIKELGGQVTHFDDAYQRADAGRTALLGWLWEVERFADWYDAQAAGGEKVPDGAAVVAALRKHTEKAHRAHGKAWER
jgi:hypothetical protein